MEVTTLARAEQGARGSASCVCRAVNMKCSTSAIGSDDLDGEEVCESGHVAAMIERIDENKWNGFDEGPGSMRTTRASRRTV
mmetsp:Transcript_54095/g.139761  ORF Transcript_54095/g.139761 Transcript_54095/m.139761 type:complete len:82 (+) Transcript_54095:882-1127(+)